jgi:hypothetical protein
VEPAGFGDILDHDQAPGPPVPVEQVGGDLDVDDPAVGLAVPPSPGALQDLPTRLEAAPQAGDVLGGMDVGDGHGEKLLPGVAVERYGGVVDLQETKGSQLVDTHGQWVGSEEQPECPAVSVQVDHLGSACSGAFGFGHRHPREVESGHRWDFGHQQ